MSIKNNNPSILTSEVQRTTIDLVNEQVVTFTELARRLPRRRGGRPTHVCTIHRWRQRGLSGIRLAAVRCGAIWVTTWEAYQRFVDALTTAVTKNADLIAVRTTLPDVASRTDQALDQLGL